MTADVDAASKPSYLAPRYWLIWIGLGVLRALYYLPLSWQFWLGRMIGRVAWRVARKRRRIAVTNIDLCFPEKSPDERARICLQHFEDLGISLFEMAQAWWAPDERFEKIVSFEGLEHVERAREQYGALIIITGHFSTLEISGRFLKQIVPQFDAIYRPHRNPLLDEKVRQGRLQSAKSLIEKSDIRTMIRNLKKGFSVWYAPDQSYRRKYAELIDFFGHGAMTNTATSRLATLGNAAVVPFYCCRETNTPHYRVRFLPALEHSPDENPSELTRRFISTLEEATRQCPSQYFWVHRKFKDRPEPLPDVYANQA